MQWRSFRPLSVCKLLRKSLFLADKWPDRVKVVKCKQFLYFYKQILISTVTINRSYILTRQRAAVFQVKENHYYY